MSLSPLPEEEEEEEKGEDGDDSYDEPKIPGPIGRAPVVEPAAITPRLDDAATSAARPRSKTLSSRVPSTIPSETPASSSIHTQPVLLLRGVLGAKTIRSAYACLHVARLQSASSCASSRSSAGGGKDDGGSDSGPGSDDDGTDDEGGDERGGGGDDSTRATYCMVRLQFTGDDGNVRALKSLCRRAFKHRDLIRVQGAALCTSGYGEGDNAPDVLRGTTNTEAPHRPPRPSSIHQGRTFVIHIGSIQEAIDTIQVETVRYWDVLTFQKWQRQNLQWMQLSSVPPQAAPRRRSSRRTNMATAEEGFSCRIQCENGDPTTRAQRAPPLSGCGGCAGQFHSSSNLDRQVQAEYVANFLFHMILNKVREAEEARARSTVTSESDGVDPDARRRDSSASPFSISNPKDESRRRGLPEIMLPPEQWATTPPLALLERLHQQLFQEDHEPSALSSSPDGFDAQDQLAAQHRYESDLARFRHAYQILNAGTGVIDVAGGSGYLSQALGACGIQATVVDPRENVGTLPRRHRKAWRKLVQRRTIKNGESDSDVPTSVPGAASSAGCVPPPPVQFQSFRAWFGTPPHGVDEGFRHPDLETKDDDAEHDINDPVSLALPVVDDSHHLLRGCSVLVALHPDEATDSVVDAAVAARKPFCVVPCCVFSRLFPNRRVVRGRQGEDGASGRPVCTRADLVDYLCEKHPSIKRATLPFVGSNTILWSTF
jgi:hypothetical protein